jgi:hypothetical protein
MNNLPEACILKACLDYMAALGIFAWRNGSGRARFGAGPSARWVQFGILGGSDILGVLPDGRALAVETKGPNGRVTVAQRVFLETVRGAGGVAIVARSVDDLINGLEEAGIHTGELVRR